MIIERVKKGDTVQIPAERAEAFDGWITKKVEDTGLLIKASHGDGGGKLLTDEALVELGYYRLNASQKKLLGFSAKKKNSRS